jgi:hypothetical protein
VERSALLVLLTEQLPLLKALLGGQLSAQLEQSTVCQDHATLHLRQRLLRHCLHPKQKRSGSKESTWWA